MAYFKTWAKVMFEPMEFYTKLPKKIRYTEPTLFAIKTYALLLGVLYVLVLLLGLFFLKIATVIVGNDLLAAVTGAGRGIFILIALLAFPLLLLLAWGLLYVGAGIIHLFVLLFGGKEGFHETFKVYCYSIAPTLFSFIPVVNYVVAIYSIILQIIGIHKRQKLSIGKSIGAVLIPTAILFSLLWKLYLPFILSAL